MKMLGILLRIMVAPIVFAVAGICGAWCYVLRKDQMDDGRPVNHDIAAVAPDEENDDRLRSHGRDQWAKDRTPLGRNDAAYVAFLEDGARVPPNPVPLREWHAKRRVRQSR